MDYTSTAWNFIPVAAVTVMMLGMAGFTLMDHGRARAAALFASRTAPKAAPEAQAPGRAAA